MLTIVNSASMNMEVQICLQDTDFISYGYLPKSDDPGSYSSLSFKETPYLSIMAILYVF